MHHASQPNLSAPPPPQHSIPFIKSKSTFNLRTSDSDPFYPSDPYSSSRNDYGRRHNLSKQATRTNVESKSSSEFIVPYDPQSLTQSRSTISKNSNVFSYSNGSYFSSSQSSYNSSMALSDFSATSAGSFARHKYEESQRQGENLKSSASGNNLVVDEKRVKGSSTGILRKLFSTKEAPPLPKVESLVNVSDISQEEERVSSWIDYKIDLNRANSVSAKERLIREKRVRENEGYIIFEPHKQLSNINNNEVFQTENKLDLSVINLSHVDNYVRSLKTVSSPSVMSPESFITNDLGMKYSSKLEYIRALFILCTEYFEMENASDNDAPKKVDFHQVFRSKKADSYGMASLFQFLASTMGLKTELIVGSLKTPQSIVRHYWNSVLINGEWRLIDASLGNLTNPIYEMILPNPKFHETSNECFYFLAEPLDLIYTHIPDKFEEQHIVPPIDPMVALALPPCFPSFFKNDLKIHKYNNALTKLLDFETFEIDLKVPKDIEINATVLTTKSVTNTLSQIYWKHNQRYCKIKGYLPDNQRFGFINIHSGLKGSQKSLTNIHPLSLVIPITHEGQYKPLDFVSRYPTAPSQQNDLYIKQPQNKNLKYGTDYIFSIVQHPSQALSSVASNSSKLKMALQSPSGRIQKLEKKDLSIPFGSWELHLKCNEIGVWRGLVSVDNGTSLCVFAEWSCS
jgi:transglutaminase/protease-like cytokinesis protein 3